MCTELRKSQPHTMSPVETKTKLQTELGSSKVALKGTSFIIDFGYSESQPRAENIMSSLVLAT